MMLKNRLNKLRRDKERAQNWMNNNLKKLEVMYQIDEQKDETYQNKISRVRNLSEEIE